MISFLNGVSSGAPVNATSITTSVNTPAGANRILVVVTRIQSGSCSNITYNGVGLTQITNAWDGTSGQSIWYLIAPPVGTYNLITYADSTRQITIYAWILGGVKQLSPVDTYNSNAMANPTAAGTYYCNLTTTKPGDWICAGFGDPDSATTLSGSVSERYYAHDHECSADNHGTILPAGANNITINKYGTRNSNTIAAAFFAVPEAGGAFLKNFV